MAFQVVKWRRAGEEGGGGPGRGDAGVLAVVDGQVAVDGDVADAVAEGVGLGVGGPVKHPVRVEDDQVGGHAGSNRAAVGQTQAPGWHAGHLPHSRLQRQYPLLAHVAAEHPHERAVAARVRHAAQARVNRPAVAGDRHQRWASTVRTSASSMPCQTIGTPPGAPSTNRSTTWLAPMPSARALSARLRPR